MCAKCYNSPTCGLKDSYAEFIQPSFNNIPNFMDQLEKLNCKECKANLFKLFCAKIHFHLYSDPSNDVDYCGYCYNSLPTIPSNVIPITRSVQRFKNGKWSTMIPRIKCDGCNTCFNDVLATCVDNSTFHVKPRIIPSMPASDISYMVNPSSGRSSRYPLDMTLMVTSSSGRISRMDGFDSMFDPFGSGMSATRMATPSSGRSGRNYGMFGVTNMAAPSSGRSGRNTLYGTTNMVAPSSGRLGRNTSDNYDITDYDLTD
jgi:hypothetical protein